MLAYLDALLAALTAGHAEGVRQLLALPTARFLPRDVLAEVRAAMGPARRRVPLSTLQLRHRVEQLMAGERAPRARATGTRRPHAVPRARGPFSRNRTSPNAG